MGAGIGADVEARAFERQRLHQLDYAGFRGPVGPEHRRPFQPGDRGGDEDGAPAGAPHRAEGVLGAEEDAGQVDRQHPLPVRLVEIADEAGRADPGVGDHHVEPAPALDRLGDRGLAVRLVRHVHAPGGGDRRCLLPQRRDRGARRRLVQVGGQHRRALGREAGRHRPPQARARAGDHRDFALQTTHRSLRSLQ